MGKKLFKFSEAAWRDLIYLAAVVCAVAYIVPQAWFKDITECWWVDEGAKLVSSWPRTRGGSVAVVLNACMVIWCCWG